MKRDASIMQACHGTLALGVLLLAGCYLHTMFGFPLGTSASLTPSMRPELDAAPIYKNMIREIYAFGERIGTLRMSVLLGAGEDR